MNIRIRLQRVALMTWEPLSGTRLFDQSHSTWNVSAESLLTQQVDNPRTLKGIPWSTFQMSNVKPHSATLVPVHSEYEPRMAQLATHLISLYKFAEYLYRTTDGSLAQSLVMLNGRQHTMHQCCPHRTFGKPEHSPAAYAVPLMDDACLGRTALSVVIVLKIIIRDNLPNISDWAYLSTGQYLLRVWLYW